MAVCYIRESFRSSVVVEFWNAKGKDAVEVARVLEF
jgi:hypothetical protein